MGTPIYSQPVKTINTETNVIDDLVEHNTEEKNILKALEEMAELSEVLLKYLTKAPEFKPTQDKIVEEMGDVIFRLKVVAKMKGIEDLVETRVSEKGEQMKVWLAEKNKIYG